MNKNLYRIVFNKKRGQLMAVAESAIGDGKTAGTSDGTLGASAQAIWATVRPLSLALFVAFGLAALLADPADAQTVAYRNAPATQQPTILGAANGVPVVNIQTPSAAGVSHNLYERFDVQQQGLILNNSRTNAATSLGGWIQGNPWLARGTASVILNEVVSSNPSLLAGYIEVAGNRAQVIVANPAGITCSGCGFLNASRATLTTGTPIISGGALEGYRVEGGTVRVEGTGLDATRADYTDIIARAVEVNAGLWAQNLRVTAGANRIDAANTSATPIAGGSPTPAYAIDVAQLGGMYAKKIVLVGTEAGVGVKNAGAIAASAGEVVVTADGKLTNSGRIVSGGDARITAAAGINNAGDIHAGGNATLTTPADIANSGLIAAQGATTLQATGTGSTITGTANSILAAGLTAEGQPVGSANLTVNATDAVILHGQSAATGDQQLNAQRLDITDSRISAGNLTLNASAGDIDARRTVTSVSGAFSANAAETFKHDSATTGAADIRVAASDVSNVGGKLVQSGAGNTLVNAAETFDNTSGLVSSTTTLAIRDANPAAKTLAIANTGGTVIADAAATLDAATLTGTGHVLSGGDLAVALTGDIVQSGTMQANRDATLTTTGTLTNQGTLQAGRAMRIEAGTLNNTAGAQIVASTLNLRATDTHTLTNRGLIDGTDTFIDAVTLNNLGTGAIYGNHVAINATTVNNLAEGGTAPTIAARNRLDIGAATINNRGGALIFSGGDMSLGGQLDATHQATGQATSINNVSATVEALGSLSINTASLTNQKATFATTRVSTTESPSSTAILDYAAELQFHWPIGESSATVWRDYIRDRYLNAISKLLGGGPGADLVSLYNPTPADPTVPVDPSTPLPSPTQYDEFVNVWGNLTGYSGSVGGGLTTAYRNRLATAVNAYTPSTLDDSHKIWQILVDTIAAEHPEYITQMSQTLTARGTLQNSYRQTCWDPTDDCSYVADSVSTRQTYRDQITADSPAAVIRAGGNAAINATSLNNRYSTIQAGGNMTLTGATLANTGAELYLQTDTSTFTQLWHWANRRKESYTSASSTQTLIGSAPAIISAGGSLNGDFTSRIDNVTVRENAAPVVGQTGTSPSASVTGSVAPASGVAGSPPLSIPASSLLHVNPDPSAHFLVETDPRFANYRTWLSSDYMLKALSIDPAATQKRLGDAFYEQRLITEQVAQLTSRRFLANYSNDETQYQALMDAGVTVAKAWKLIPGVALTEAQMAQLTTDIVWLVAKEVALPDGSTQRVLVPQLYAARLRADDLTPTGALIAANDLRLNTSGTLATSGALTGREVVALTAENIDVLRGRVAGRDLSLQASNDLTVIGGTVEAERTLLATAGHDLTVASSTADRSYRPPAGTAANAKVEKTVVDRVAGLYVTGDATTGAGGTLIAAAGHDLALLGAALVNTRGTAASETGTATGATVLAAGNNLTLGTVTETSQASTRTKKARWQEATTNEVGSTLAVEGDLTLQAGHDLTARAASVAASGTLAATAAHDLTITAGEATYASELYRKSSSRGVLSSKKSERKDMLQTTTALASSFAGDTVALSAGNDLTVKGSTVSATGDLALAAARDVVLDTAQDTRHETHYRKESRSGLRSSYGGVSYGKSSLQESADGTSVTQVTSTLAGQNVTVTSGRDTVVRAASVLADRDITLLAGRNVDILAAADTQAIETQRKSSSRSIGLTPDTFGKLTIFGTMAASEDTDGQSAAARTALLSANAGNLTVRAGLDSQYKGTGQGNVVTQGADLLAGQTIALSGNAVDLQAAADTNPTHSVAKSKSVTLGASLAGPIGEKINAIGDAVKAAHDSDNDRLKGAFALKAGYDAYKLSQMDTIPGSDPTSVAGATKDFGTAGGASASSGFGVQVAIGTSKSKAETTTHDTRVTGTNLQAQTIDIAATESDLAMAAAKLQARNITLAAARDVLLTAAANTSDLASTNKGSNAGFGVTFAFGGQQNGFSIQVSASQSKGKANGTETTWDNTQVTAAETLKVTSGRDATLRGAQLAGDTVLFDVGRDLLVETLQDSSVYYSKQSSSGFSLSLCIPPICAGTYVTGSVSASSQKIKHDYLSAVGQSGIAAGAGGFDITVKGATDLVGAAITSTADTEKNKLTTASLTSRDLDNHQVTKASASSVNLSYNGGSALGTLGSNAASNLMGNLNGNAALPKNQKEASQTQSVISPAQVTITGSGDTAKDAQSRATADELTARDPKTANQSLTNTLTLQQAQVLEDKIAKQKQNQQAAQIVGAVLSNAVGDYAQKQGWAEGSPQKLALHGLVGLIEAKIGGGNAAAGILGAVSQEALAPLLSDYLKQNGFDYTKIDITDPNLSEAERQARLEEYNRLRSDYYGLMQLGTTLAGTAIGAVAGGTQGAATGATSAYVGVTNNYLKHDEAIRMAALKEKKLKGQCDTTCQQDIAALEKIDQDRNAQLDACQGVSSQACNNARQEVRNAAAEYLRKGTIALSSGSGYITLENVYGSEEDETLRYAQGTLDGKTKGMASGLAGAAADMVVDTAKALYRLAVNLGGAAIGDAQARQTLQAGAGAAWDYVKNPDNWPYLLGVMTPEQREKLAQAYEKGDGYAVGQIMGKQTLDLVANLPSGGAAGTIKIVKAGDRIEDAASIAAKLEKSNNTIVDIAHTIGADYNPRTEKVTGGHTLLNNDVKVLEIVSPPDANGVYIAKVEMKTPDGQWIEKTSNRGSNTMFPQSWDATRVEAEISSAWARRTPHPDGTPNKWIGTSSSGVAIEGYERPRATAYPVYRGNTK